MRKFLGAPRRTNPFPVGLTLGPFMALLIASWVVVTLFILAPFFKGSLTVLQYSIHYYNETRHNLVPLIQSCPIIPGKYYLPFSPGSVQKIRPRF
jgi:hypothetical protein